MAMDAAATVPTTTETTTNTSAPPTCTPPTSETFSFKAPFPPSQQQAILKQRRVSLALPASSPRVVPAWSFRDDTRVATHSPAPPESLVPEKKGKLRKIAPEEEDDDDEREFELGAGGKKPRKKWTMEETQMLVDGCNTWGVGNWKAILKDPKFKFDNRSPVDLKDRFRTYFPDAYKEHYPNAKTHLSSKVRSTLPDGTPVFSKTRSKKRRPFTEAEDAALRAGYAKHGTVWAAIAKDPVFQAQHRRSTDLRDRFRNAFPDLYQAAGYKPRTAPKRKKKGEPETAPEMDQDQDQDVKGKGKAREWVPVVRRAATDDQLPSASSTISSARGPPRRRRAHTTQGWLRGGTKSVPESTTCSEDEDDHSSGGEDNGTNAAAELPAAAQELADALGEVDMDAPFSSEPAALPDFLAHPPHDDQHAALPWTAGSPTSSHISSDYFVTQSPFPQHRHGEQDMIGKSAWAPQDWFSLNPRLEHSSGAPSSSASSFIDLDSELGVAGSPFSSAHGHGVLDRYGLFPASSASSSSLFLHDYAASASEIGLGDAHSTFSDPESFAPSGMGTGAGGLRGFTHHSNYAGDLIFGARTHQPQPPPHHSQPYGFGFGLLASPPHQSTGIHPMQLHTPALAGIDEIELAAITLNDHEPTHDAAMDPLPHPVDVPKDAGDVDAEMAAALPFLSQQGIDELVNLDLAPELHSTPPATPLHRSQRAAPATPSVHGRSISVPPSEYRAAPSRPPPMHANSQPQVSRVPPVPPFSQQQPQPQPPSQTQTQTQEGMWAGQPQGAGADQMYDLPFLDLHYYGSNHSAINLATVDEGAAERERAASDSMRRGQALDLAGPIKGASGQAASGKVRFMPSLGQSITQSFALAAGKMSLHHRGQSQSAVSPQDLLTRKGSDNKRKRASWDGGIS